MLNPYTKNKNIQITNDVVKATPESYNYIKIMQHYFLNNILCFFVTYSHKNKLVIYTELCKVKCAKIDCVVLFPCVIINFPLYSNIERLTKLNLHLM